MSKRVQFSGEIEFINTFANEDYDRTAQEVAKLTYKDMLELLTMKSQWRRDMERMIAERDNSEQEKDDDDDDDSSSNSSGSSDNSSTNTASNKPGHVFNTPEICT